MRSQKMKNFERLSGWDVWKIFEHLDKRSLTYIVRHIWCFIEEEVIWALEGVSSIWLYHITEKSPSEWIISVRQSAFVSTLPSDHVNILMNYPHFSKRQSLLDLWLCINKVLRLPNEDYQARVCIWLFVLSSPRDFSPYQIYSRDHGKGSLLPLPALEHVSTCNGIVKWHFFAWDIETRFQS